MDIGTSYLVIWSQGHSNVMFYYIQRFKVNYLKNNNVYSKVSLRNPCNNYYCYFEIK